MSTAVSLLIFAGLVTGSVLWAAWDQQRIRREAQQVLEQNFKQYFRRPYPANEGARRVLIPFVARELTIQRNEITTVEEKEQRILKRIQEASISTNPAIAVDLMTAFYEYEEEIENKKTDLQARFRVSCRVARKAGFERTAKVSGCYTE